MAVACVSPTMFGVVSISAKFPYETVTLTYEPKLASEPAAGLATSPCRGGLLTRVRY